MADLASGEVFVDGQAVTGARLNNAVNGATILPGFVSRLVAGTPIVGDYVVWSDAATGLVLKKVTLTNLFSLITADGADGVASLRTLGFTGQKAAKGSATPQLTADNSLTGRNHITHLTGDIANQPTCTVNAVNTTGAGVGATATLGVQGCDWFGQVLLTPSGTPGASAKMFTINTFHLSFVTNAPAVFIIPINAAAVIAFQAAGKAVVQANVTTSGFEVWSGTTALSAGTAYALGYLALGG